MNAMGTEFRRGRKRIRTLLLCALLAVGIVMVSVFSALAADVTGTFKLIMPEMEESYNELTGKSTFTAKGAFSTNQSVNLLSDELFTADDLNNIKRISIKMTRIYKGGNIQPTIDDSVGDIKADAGGGNSHTSTVTATSNDGFTKDDVDRIFSHITLKFNTASSSTSATGSISVCAYNNINGSDRNQLDTIYNYDVTFYNFAQGAIEEDSVKVRFANKDADLNTVTPDDSGMGTVTMNTKITRSGGNTTVAVGYQVKKATDAWTEEIPVLGLEDHTYAVTDNALLGKIPLTVTGLDPDQTYDIRAVFISDGKAKAAEYTDSVRVSYNRPVINTFSIGDTNASYVGGTKKDVSTVVTFQNTNYDDQTNTVGGSTYDGPQLKVALYFTNKLTQADGVDSSEWEEVNSYVIPMQDKPNRSANQNFSYTLPNKDGVKTFAYKLVVTDLVSNYSVYSYSKPFTVDSTPPTAPQVVRDGNADTNLTDGTALVGGDGAKFTLKIGKSTDLASGVQEYSYSMFYLPTDKGDAFAHAYGQPVTAESILRTMHEKLKDASTYADATYTDWTGLPATGEDGYTSLSVSKDGYYYIQARAKDNVGKYSAENAVALFRVDLTVPNVPEIRLAQPKVTMDGEGNVTSIATVNTTRKTVNGKERTVLTNVNELEGYDGRTYSENKVWLFARSVPLTGKSIDIDSYEFSTDGGLTWKKMADQASFVVYDGTDLVNMYAANADGGADYTKKNSKFTFDVGFRLSDVGDGFQTVIVRAADTLGNTSLASPTREMRQSPDITVNGSLALNGIEVAIAMGNTTKNIERITPNLKNRSAQKINESYYGKLTADSSADTANDNFTPLALVATQDPTTKAWTYHTCTWKNGGTNCDDDDCPYKVYGGTYELFTPSMVNVQGVEGASANNTSQFQWVRYDHTNYHEYATVGYLGDMYEEVTDDQGTTSTKFSPAKAFNCVVAPKPTTLQGNDQYYDKKSGLYTASLDRVVDLQQSTPPVYTGTEWDPVSKTNVKKYTWDYLGNTTSGTYAAATCYQNGGSGRASHWDGGTDDLSMREQGKVGFYNGTNQRRVYHVMDLSYVKSGNYYLLDSPDGSPLSRIGCAGYGRTAFREWLFLYNSQSTNKSIYFTVNDAETNPHASDGYGFLYNTTIRQSKQDPTYNDATADGTKSDGSWRISGYLFYIGNQYVDRGTFAWMSAPYNQNNHTESNYGISGFRFYVLRLDDINVEHFSDAVIRGSAGYDPATGSDYVYAGNGQPDGGWVPTINTSGYGHSEAFIGSARNMESGWDWGQYLGQYPQSGHGIIGNLGSYEYMDDLIKYVMYGGDKAEGRNGNYWISSTQKPAEGSNGKPSEWTEANGTHLDYSNNKAPGINYGIEQMAMYEDPSTLSVGDRYVRNYVIQLEGECAKFYVWKSAKVEDGYTVPTTEEVKAKFAESITEENPLGYADDSQGYKLIQWQDIKEEDKFFPVDDETGERLEWNYGVNSPRPSVDGLQIGSREAKVAGVHSDSNCYGFGPLFANRAFSHTCGADTRVIMSNMMMDMNVARSLNEVITTPKWGSGQAKYVLNITDDSVAEFDDPLTASSISWRLNLDQARLISWGSSDNQEANENFMKTTPLGGHFQSTEKPVTYDPIPEAEQLDSVAEYIATTYFETYGMSEENGSISGQVSENVQKKGVVYSLSDAEKMTFRVSPEEYNESTANADYPSGRWYFIHNTEGYYENGAPLTPDPRSGTFSNALNLKITQPGRYTVYFAPDEEKRKNGTLDPSDDSCIFDFIVNQPPTASFNGSVQVSQDGKSSTITINDNSNDPDTDRTPDQEQPKDANGTQLTGIQETLWRWDMLATYVDPITSKEATFTLMSQETWQSSKDLGSINPYNGKTLAELTKAVGHLTDLGNQRLADMPSLTPETDGSGKKYYNIIPDGVVIQVYEKVRDVSTWRTWDKTKKAYVYTAPEVNPVAESTICQQNLLNNNVPITLSPKVSMGMSPTEMFDTATGEQNNGAGVPNDSVLVTRQAVQDQGKDLILRWELTAQGVTYPLEDKDGNLRTWIVPNAESVTDASGGTVNIPAALRGQVVLTVYQKNGVDVEAPSSTGGVGKGQWLMKKDFIALATGGNFGSDVGLTIYDGVMGRAVSGQTEDKLIEDKSGRSIYYRQDTAAPSLQKTTINTYVTTDNWTTETRQDYQASNYLDVTGKDKEIRIEVSGSSDVQGKVAGYGYYFYDYAADGVTVERIWKQNEHGALIEVGSKNDGRSIQDKAREAVGRVNASGAQVTGGAGMLPSSGGTIVINSNSLRDEFSPNDSLNVAIFAFDNQYFKPGEAIAADNLTRANETARSRIENIKLAAFNPMPAEIKAVNALGETVAYVGNNGGFKVNGIIPGDTQNMNEAVQSNSDVTVQFTPKQGWFSKSGEQYTFEPTVTDAIGGSNDNYFKYYMDVNKKADLTNVAKIKYLVEKEQNGSYVNVTPSSLGGDPATGTVDPTKQLTINDPDGGKFRITARVVNGSGVESAIRQIVVTIDRKAPQGTQVTLTNMAASAAGQAGQPYNAGSGLWGKDVEMRIHGATDQNKSTAYYWYTLDNGQTSYTGNMGLEDVTVRINQTGEYNIRVKAIDRAGNEVEAFSGQVLIDNTAPTFSAPKLTVSSSELATYTNYVMSIRQVEGGSLYLWNGTEQDEVNTEIMVEVHGSKQFLITPDAGKELQKVTFGTRTFTTSQMTKRADGSYLLNVSDVTENGIIYATFGNTGSTPQSLMLSTRSTFAALRAAKEPVETAAEETEPMAVNAASVTTEAVAEEEEKGITAISTGDEEISIAANETFSVIDVTSDANAVVTFDQEEVAAGGSVLVTIRPAFGYLMGTLQIMREGGSFETVSTTPVAGEEGAYQYTIENITTNVYVQATAIEKKPHTLTVSVTGSGKIQPSSEGMTDNGGSYTFFEQTPITLTFVPDSEDYILTSLAINGVDADPLPAGDTYVIPASATTGDIAVTANFGVAGDVTKYNVTTSITGGEHGTVTPIGVPTGTPGEYRLQVPEKRSLTLTITPESGYTATASATTYVDGTWKPNEAELVQDGDVLMLTIRSIESAVRVNVTFERKMWKVFGKAESQAADGSTEAGGSVYISGEGYDRGTSKAYENSELTCAVRPNPGWYLSSVKVNGSEWGCRGEFKFIVSQDYSIVATFVQSQFVGMETTHTIRAEANNISDSHQLLHAQGYNFGIKKVGDASYEFSGWQAESIKNFTTYKGAPLEPNTQYSVLVRARDASENATPAEETTVTEDGEVIKNFSTEYTLANAPTAESVSEVDQADVQGADKSVSIRLDTRGNPNYTKYRVYYSRFANMSQRGTAVVSNGTEESNNGWSTLDATNSITVLKLTAGTRYYFQVVAQSDGTDNPATATMDQNILNITLSPSSPAENSLCFEEQAAPGGTVKLSWTTPGGDVNGFEIYRDGTKLDRVSSTTVEYYDRTADVGDSLHVYSYAYVNSANNVGSRRTAVNKVLYDAAQNDEAQKQKLLKLAEDLNAGQVYNQSMTYPSFPTGINLAYSEATAKEEDNQNSGYANICITAGTSAARNQKYEVGIQAYSVDEGTGEHHIVESWNWKDHLTTTTSINSRGAYAEWTNLPINYEYRVFVNKVMSTGKPVFENDVIVDGYGGSEDGIEGTFGKQCWVTKDGYGYQFLTSSTQVKEVMKDQTFTWEDDTARDKYAYKIDDGNGGFTGGWDQPIQSDYIKFNKSPHIEVVSADVFEGSDGKIVKGTDGSESLIVDRDGTMQIKVNVKVYDPDGPAYETSVFRITGTLNGQAGSCPEVIHSVAKTEAEAQTYQIVFNGMSLSTGVYQNLEVSVSDGGTRASKSFTEGTSPYTVMVNRIQPSITSSTNGAIKAIEVGRDYGTEDENQVKVTSSLSSGSVSEGTLRALRLQVMAEEYDAAFGAHTVAGILGNLNMDDATAIASAKKLLGDQYDTVAAGGFSRDETQDIIDRLNPEIQAWFAIDEQTYNDFYGDGTAETSSQVFKQTVGNSIRYWVKKDFGFENNLCQFLQKDPINGHITVKSNNPDVDYMSMIGQQHQVLLTSSFGGNTTTSSLYFKLTTPVTVEIQSDKVWKWVEVTPEEFTDVKFTEAFNNGTSEVGTTIGDQYNKYKASWDKGGSGMPWELYPDDPELKENMPAYKPADATGTESVNFYVYKMVDTKVSVTRNTVTATLDVNTGIYNAITDVQVVYTTLPPEEYKPEGDKEFDTSLALRKKVTDSQRTGKSTFTLTDLEAGDTYYIWICYTTTDPDTKAETRHYAPNFVAATTMKDYKASLFGFQEVEESVEETADTTGDGQSLTYTIARTQDLSSTAVLVPTIRYYKADQDGNILKNEDGSEQEITQENDPERYAAAKNTLYFTNADPNVSFGVNDTQKYLFLTLRNTTEEQGHMVARVTLEVDRTQSTGYNWMTENGATLSVFVLDDDSYVVTYTMEMDTALTADPNPGTKPGKYYEYSFDGINESNLSPAPLELVLRNSGDGELTEITAELYDESQESPTMDFVIGQQPNNRTLASPQVDPLARTELSVSPESDLQDGIYEGWLKISWAKMKEEDAIWVHLHQVAYQSTLQGTVYLTAEKPMADSTQWMGYSMVKVYEDPGTNTSTLQKNPLGEPLYTTRTDQFGNYTIYNILNNKKYFIIIERPGFITYDAYNRNMVLNVGKDSKIYDLSVRLVGGDANATNNVDTNDYDALDAYYNWTYDSTYDWTQEWELKWMDDAHSTAQWVEKVDAPKVSIDLLIRDFNGDGAVNALDRMVVWNNQGKNRSVYSSTRPVVVN